MEFVRGPDGTSYLMRASYEEVTLFADRLCHISKRPRRGRRWPRPRSGACSRRCTPRFATCSGRRGLISPENLSMLVLALDRVRRLGELPDDAVPRRFDAGKHGRRAGRRDLGRRLAGLAVRALLAGRGQAASGSVRRLVLARAAAEWRSACSILSAGGCCRPPRGCTGYPQVHAAARGQHVRAHFAVHAHRRTNSDLSPNASRTSPVKSASPSDARLSWETRMKVIVPCCGSSSRFPGQPPKWTLPAHDGRPMLCLAVCRVGVVARRSGGHDPARAREHVPHHSRT